MSSTALDRDTTTLETRSRFSRKRVLLGLAGLGVLAAIGWYGSAWWETGRFIESTDDAYVGGNLTTIAPHVSGFIDAVSVTDHQRVQAGQILIKLDPRDYQAALARANAVVAGKIAALESLRAQLALQQSMIQQRSAELDVKSAQASFAATDADRYRTLATSAAGSRQEEQRSSSLTLQARAAVLSAQAGLQAARQQLPVLAAQVTEAEAAVTQARADVDVATLNLGYTEIRSPIDGFVGNRAAQIGAYVPQAGYLLSITPARGLWVDANFKEDQLAGVAAGRRATILADSVPGHVFQGHVVSLSPGTGAVYSVIPPENATGNFTKIVQRVPVRIAFDGADELLTRLRPGLSITVQVDTRASASP